MIPTVPSPPLQVPRVRVPVEDATPEQQLNQAKFYDRMFDTLVLYYTYGRRGAHVYERGDVPRHVIARRRARNKVARVSRRKNR